jgi:CRISPR system Cascade subunit CasE
MVQRNTYGVHQLLWDLFPDCNARFLYREELAQSQIRDHNGIKGESVWYLLSVTPPVVETPLFAVDTRPFEPQLQTGQHLAFRLRANPVVTRSGKRHDLVMDEQRSFYRQLAARLGLPNNGTKRALRQQLLLPELADPLRDLLCEYSTDLPVALAAQPAEALEQVLRERTSQRLAAWLCGNKSREGVLRLAARRVVDEEQGREYDRPFFQWSGYQTHALPEKGRAARFCSVDLAGELIVQNPEKLRQLICTGIGPAKGFGCGLMMIKAAFGS